MVRGERENNGVLFIQPLTEKKPINMVGIKVLTMQ